MKYQPKPKIDRPALNSYVVPLPKHSRTADALPVIEFNTEEDEAHRTFVREQLAMELEIANREGSK